jgi:hypothetical protein
MPSPYHLRLFIACNDSDNPLLHHFMSQNQNHEAYFHVLSTSLKTMFDQERLSSIKGSPRGD